MLKQIMKPIFARTPTTREEVVGWSDEEWTDIQSRFLVDEGESKLGYWWKLADEQDQFILKAFYDCSHFHPEALYSLNDIKGIPVTGVIYIDPLDCMVVVRRWFDSNLKISLQTLTLPQIKNVVRQVELIARELEARDIELSEVRLSDVLLDSKYDVYIDGITTRIPEACAEISLRTKVDYHPYSDYVDIKDLMRSVQLSRMQSDSPHFQ